MRVGELARLSGVPASTLRYYESNGLLPAPRRAGNGYRDYPADSLERVGLIRLAQSLGFQLEQIRELFGRLDQGSPHALIEDELHTRLAEVERLQQALGQQRQGLLDMLAELRESRASGRCLSLAELAGRAPRRPPAMSRAAGQGVTTALSCAADQTGAGS